jgi:hypothetical protein
MPVPLVIALAAVAVVAALAAELYFASDAVLERFFMLAIRLRYRASTGQTSAALAGVAAVAVLHTAAGLFRLAALAAGMAWWVIDRGAARIGLALATVERRELPA